ncbi:MAG: hypothetical protein WEB09_10570 [Nitriliruptor sp.]
MPPAPPTAPLDGPRTLEVLASLDAQLGHVDPDARAVVALTAGEGGSVALTDVALRDDGVLEVAGDVLGIVVVTSEDVRLDDADEVVPLRQLVAVLPDGTEVGIVRVGDDPEPRIWAAGDAVETDGDTSSEGLRPRDVTANAARRALGLPSLAEVPPVEDLLARAWLLQVAEEGLSRFDSPDGPREVEPEELAHLDGADPLSGLCTGDPAAGETDIVPTWEQVRDAAARGDLQLASYTVEPTHAAWLDAAGFAQVVDRTLPSTEELLGTLRLVGEDPLVGWAIDHIAERGWGRPV